VITVAAEKATAPGDDGRPRPGCRVAQAPRPREDGARVTAILAVIKQEVRPLDATPHSTTTVTEYPEAPPVATGEEEG